MEDDDYELDAVEDSDERHTLLDNDKNTDVDKKGSHLYAHAVEACGFGVYHAIILTVLGSVLASNAVEMYVVSFVLPSACDFKMTSTQKGWLNAIIFIGMMVGGFLFGGAADVKGRRYMLIWSMSINGLFGLASAFAPNYGWFLSLRFMSGIGVGAAMPIIFAYCVEFTSTSQRGPVIVCLATFWIFGNCLTCILAWLIIPHVELSRSLNYIVFLSWRIFVVICALPSLISVALVYILPESPMYLHNVGKYAECYDIFIKMFRRNYGGKTPIPPEINEFEEFYKSSISSPAKGTRSDSQLCISCVLCLFVFQMLEVIKILKVVAISTRQLFLNPLLSRTLMLIIIWFSLLFGYYGMWIWLPEIFRRVESGFGSVCTNAVVHRNMSLNLTCREINSQPKKFYIESLVIALSNIPFSLLTIVLVNRLGHRPLMAVSMILSSISAFFSPLISNRVEMVALFCVFSSITIGGWNTLNLLAVENYPTELRSTAFGVQSVFGNIAAITGHLAFGALVDQHCAVPIILVAVILAIGGLTALKLPKTDVPLT